MSNTISDKTMLYVSHLVLVKYSIETSGPHRKIPHQVVVYSQKVD